MYKQTTSGVLMVRPCAFGFNPETAANNAFQKKGDQSEAQINALKEFDGYVDLLRSLGVRVNVVEDTMDPHTPDSIFPNNWFSTHSDGTMVLYPMFAPNRRMERKEGVMNYIIENFDITTICDLTAYEEKGKFLEGTGSMVIDRKGGVVYACRSPRTDEEVLKEFCKVFKWKYLLFDAVDENGGAIYHTNVMMSVGSSLAVVCLNSIADPKQRQQVLDSLLASGREVVDITFEQMNNFAGNMLEVQSAGTESLKAGSKILVMSATARRSLTSEQVAVIEKYCTIAAPELHCIEVNGGGSARCMLAEVFFN